MNIKRVLVIGAGTMGRGIAQWLAQQNLYVEIVDINAQATKDAQSAIFLS